MTSTVPNTIAKGRPLDTNDMPAVPMLSKLSSEACRCRLRYVASLNDLVAWTKRHRDAEAVAAMQIEIFALDADLERIRNALGG